MFYIRKKISGYSSEEWFCAALVLYAVLFNLIFLYPEVSISIPNLNDNVLHYSLIERAGQTLGTKESTLDHWDSRWVMGFPVFHYYQHLPHIFVAAIHSLTGKSIELFTLFNWTKYLLLAFFPISVFFGLRKMEFSRSTAALSALCSSLLSTRSLFGFDFSSYVWQGPGLFTQLAGMFLLPLCIGQVYSTVRHGKGFFWSVLLVVATLLSHVVYGYIAIFSLLVLLLFKDEQAGYGQRTGRLAIILALSGVISSYFLIPYFTTGSYLNRSVWEAVDKYDSYGHEWVIGSLFNGDLLDYGRLPVLTLLMFIGLAQALTERKEHQRVIFSIFFLWLILYFGRPTWGILLKLLPLSNDLHFHRLIGGVHLAAIPLIGIGIKVIWDGLVSRSERRVRTSLPTLVVAVALIAVVLVPVWRDRINYLDENKLLMSYNQEEFKRQEQNLRELLDLLKGLEKESPARIYAGLPGNWGGKFTVGNVPLYAILSAGGIDTLSHAYHAMSFSADIQYHFNENDPAHYDLFNIGYVVAPSNRPVQNFLSPVKTIGEWTVYRSKTTGYFDLVRSDLAFYGPKEAIYRASLGWLGSPLFKAKEHPAVLFKKSGTEQYRNLVDIGKDVFALPAPESLPGQSDNGQIVSQAVEGQIYSATVNVKNPCYLLFKMTYHPYWRVLVDGVARDAVMVAPTFTGLSLEPGEHQIRFEYRPPIYKSLLFLFGLLVLIGTLFFDRRLNSASDLLSGLDRWIEKLRDRLQGTKVLLMPLVLLFFVSLVAALPLFQGKVLSGHDSMKYPVRAATFYRSLAEGHLFPRWSQDLAAGYGEPALNFVPPFNNYIVTALHLTGLGFINSVNLTCFILLLVAGISMYALASQFFGRHGGMVAGAAYIFAPYMLVELYVRGDYSEFAALCLVPLLFYVFYRLTEGPGMRSMTVASLVMSMVLLCNNPASLIIMPFLGLFVAVIVVRRRDYRAGAYAFSALLLGLLTTAFFWLPAFIEKDLVQTRKVIEGWWQYQNHFLYLKQLIYSPWGYFYNDFPRQKDTMSFQIGPVNLILSVFALVVLIGYGKQLNERQRFITKFFLAVIAVAAFLVTEYSAFIWNRISLLHYLQFPWRYLIVITASASFLCAVPFFFIPENKDLSKRLAIAIVAAILFFGYSHARPFRFLDATESSLSPENMRQNRLEITTVLEYRPRWAKEEPQNPANAIFTLQKGSIQFQEERVTSTNHALHLNALEDSLVRINIHYFPGWRVLVDQKEVAVNYENSFGLMDISIPKGSHEIEIQFVDTPVRTAGEIASLLGILIILICSISGVVIRRPQRHKEHKEIFI